MMDKSAEAFRTISEAAEELHVPQHVLRFWETRFTHIKPMKRAGGRRYYRPEDMALLHAIRHLLYGEGYTIRGVQRLLKEQSVKAVVALAQAGAQPLALRKRAGVPVISIDGDERTSQRPSPHAARDANFDVVPEASDDGADEGQDLEPLFEDEAALAPLHSHTEPQTPPPLLSSAYAPAALPRFAQSMPAAAAGLTPHHIDELRAILADLGECERILARARHHLG
jgi:DNA-binding transcriptional MerR regulator